MKFYYRLTLLIFLLAAPAAGRGGEPDASAAKAQARPYRLTAIYPHDGKIFTQGLVYSDGLLYESGGGYGDSLILARSFPQGVLKATKTLPAPFFAEGLALVGDRLIQLTWKAGKAFERDPGTLDETGGLSYAGEGWGIAWDGARLVTSDGTPTLTFRDPGSFAPASTIQVRDGASSVTYLNELEFYQGLILANVWQSPRIAAIDPETGRVAWWLDLSSLVSRFNLSSHGVANGVALSPKPGRLLVTGKNWPLLFEIEPGQAAE